MDIPGSDRASVSESFVASPLLRGCRRHYLSYHTRPSFFLLSASFRWRIPQFELATTLYLHHLVVLSLLVKGNGNGRNPVFSSRKYLGGVHGWERRWSRLVVVRHSFERSTVLYSLSLRLHLVLQCENSSFPSPPSVLFLCVLFLSVSPLLAQRLFLYTCLHPPSQQVYTITQTRFFVIW